MSESCRHQWYLHRSDPTAGTIGVHCRACGRMGEIAEPSAEDWRRVAAAHAAMSENPRYDGGSRIVLCDDSEA